jgi:hypothetical protein
MEGDVCNNTDAAVDRCFYHVLFYRAAADNNAPMETCLNQSALDFIDHQSTNK